MSNKPKRGLGRSLEALLGDFSKQPVKESLRLEGELRQLSLNCIVKGKYQPRKEFNPDALHDLADSIRAQGVIQPIVVRSLDMNQYEIVAGERRFRAAEIAGLESIPALVREVPDEATLAMALIENLQREDLNVIEQAMALKRLIDEFNLTHEHVANVVGKSRAGVSNLLRLLSLPDDVKYLLEQNQLDMGHARALLALPFERQSEVAKLVVLKGLSVREAEQFVKQMIHKNQAPSSMTPYPISSIEIKELKQQFLKRLALKTDFKKTSQGLGKVVIHLQNPKELELLKQFLEK